MGPPAPSQPWPSVLAPNPRLPRTQVDPVVAGWRERTPAGRAQRQWRAGARRPPGHARHPRLGSPARGLLAAGLGGGGGGAGGGVVPVERVVVASGLAPRARLEAAEEAEMAPAPLAKWWRPWWPTASCPPASLRRLKGEGQHCLTEGLSGCQFCVHASVMSHGSHSRPTGHGVECWPRPPAFQTRWWPSGRRRSGESPKTRPPSRGRAPGAGTRG